MSRSYKKNGFDSCVCYFNQKNDRKVYARHARRKSNRILKECEKEYRDCDFFEPYESFCCLHREVCDIDDEIWWHPNPSEIVINVDENSFNGGNDHNICIGCPFSENNRNQFSKNIWREAPEDKLVSGIDYSVKYADKWSWASDGGVYFQADIEQMRKEFNEDVFGIAPYRQRTIWDEYKSAVENKDWWHSNWFLLDMCFENNIIPKTFKKPEELINWFRKNEERILKLWFKRRFHK